MNLARESHEDGHVADITRNHNEDLDQVDLAIIRHLQEDGRIPFARLGPLVGLSPEASRQRVKRLIDDGILQIVGVTDPLRLGFAVHTFVLIRATADLDEVADRIAQVADIDYVAITTGRFDILAEVICEDSDRLLDILNELKSIDGVNSAEALNFLRLVRGTFEWGTPGAR
jgi:Lrp/AsnC family transcriptional regulator for asnA, asnC and gidA